MSSISFTQGYAALGGVAPGLFLRVIQTYPLYVTRPPSVRAAPTTGVQTGAFILYILNVQFLQSKSAAMFLAGSNLYVILPLKFGTREYDGPGPQNAESLYPLIGVDVKLVSIVYDITSSG